MSGSREPPAVSSRFALAAPRARAAWLFLVLGLASVASLLAALTFQLPGGRRHLIEHRFPCAMRGSRRHLDPMRRARSPLRCGGLLALAGTLLQVLLGMLSPSLTYRRSGGAARALRRLRRRGRPQR